jgi:hypothetical protein
MPETLRQLHKIIQEESGRQGLTSAQIHYAVGYILFDVFERADHEESRLGASLTPEAFDKLAAELAPRKISRSIETAQEEFGKAAAQFMDDEIQNRIAEAIDRSVVSEVKAIVGQIASLISGSKVFWWNVAASVLGGVFLAVSLIVAAVIWDRDPSPIAAAKHAMHAQTSSLQLTDEPKDSAASAAPSATLQK